VTRHNDILTDIVFAPDSRPFFEIIPSVASVDDIESIVDEEANYADCLSGKGMADLTVQIVRLNNDLVFLTAPMIKDTLVDEIINKRGNKFKALIIDFTDVKLVDISGMMALSECASHTRAKRLRFVLVNVRARIHDKLVKFGIDSDEICLDRINMASTGDLRASILRAGNANYFSGIIHDEHLCLLGNDPDASGSEPELHLGGIDIDEVDGIDIDEENSLHISGKSNSSGISLRKMETKENHI
jgi:anti-anti-sigma regulatory factor